MPQVYVQWDDGTRHPAGWRYCSDIGLYALDRSRERSCVFATPYCRETCYNAKLERGLFARGMATRDVSNDIFWARGGDLAETLPRNARRARLMTRGEAFASKRDVARIEALANARPDVVFWIPTRAWRSRVLRPMLEALRQRCPNLRILAALTRQTRTPNSRCSPRADGRPCSMATTTPQRFARARNPTDSAITLARKHGDTWKALARGARGVASSLRLPCRSSSTSPDTSGTGAPRPRLPKALPAERFREATMVLVVSRFGVVKVNGSDKHAQRLAAKLRAALGGHVATATGNSNGQRPQQQR